MEQRHRNSKRKHKVVVFGGSVSGLMSALILVKKGFDVSIYEKRKIYGRNIQWGIRQCFIDYLSAIDPYAADEFYRKASPLKYGHRFIADKSFLYENGAYIHRIREVHKQGSYIERDLSAELTLDEEIVCVIPAKVLENILCNRLLQHGITINHVRAPDITFIEEESSYCVCENGVHKKYDLIVVSEGASSETREKVGIESMSLSRSVKQVSGEIYLKRGGMITEYIHAVKPKCKLRDELLLSALVCSDRHHASWIVGDLSLQCISNLRKARQRFKKDQFIEKEFRQIAARTMLDTVRNIKDAGYQGAVREIEMFELQAKISNKVVAGKNLVLTGDAVGVGHWAVGGGLHVASTSHIQKLEILASSIKENDSLSRRELESYNAGVISDTRAWISRSIRYYYLSIPPEVVTGVFDIIFDEVMKKNSMNVPKKIKDRVTEIYFG